MRAQGQSFVPAKIPGSVYSNLIANGSILNPYAGENELAAMELCRQDYEFEKAFDIDEAFLQEDCIYLHLDGIDTLADLFLNGQKIGHIENMHRTYEFDITSLLTEGTNRILFHFFSPLQYLEEKQKEDPLWGPLPSVEGFPHIRKAHYMYGWDWGPKLPDIGIYRDASIIGHHKARITDTSFHQVHESDRVTLITTVSIHKYAVRQVSLLVTVYDDDSNPVCSDTAIFDRGTSTLSLNSIIDHPKLWWPNGLGSQSLYHVTVQLTDHDLLLEERQYQLGLRTMTISQEPDQWGKEFCVLVNGLRIFTMGADYIPEDNIIPFCTKERTRLLLEQCRDDHFNCIRVWGGGYYPENWFFDLCDQLGLIVWQDFMYACGVYRLTPSFCDEVRAEAVDNLRRIRHHACLLVLCGNNEMESAWVGWNLPEDPELRQDYLTQFEVLLPSICKEEAPDIFYWPSSPSSGGGFIDTGNPDIGDTHYWEVWHGMKPKTEFFKHYFRFCSEFGFESLPSVKTIEAFTTPKDRNLFSPVMELHQKCEQGNQKLLYYLSESTRYPENLSQLVYATQLIQAEAIEANVAHMRRNRGRCMGSIYWQLNDSNPVISWSSIDYYGRKKALQYYTRRFYAPVLLSADITDLSAIRLNISNETLLEFHGTIALELRGPGSLLYQEARTVSIAALSCSDSMTLDLKDMLSTKERLRSCHLTYRLTDSSNNLLSENSELFVPLKEFSFSDPSLKVNVSEKPGHFLLEVHANEFAKSIYIDLAHADCTFSDNWFNLEKDACRTITVLKSSLSVPLTQDSFEKELRIMSAFSIGR